MKTTTTLEDIIRVSAKRSGYDAIIDEHGLFRLQGQRTNLIQQINDYTDFIQQVCDQEIFGWYSFQNKDVDKFFKRAFLLRFLNREIAFQTVDIFRSKLVSKMLINEQWLTEVYVHFDDIFNGLDTGSQDSTNHSLTETNNTTDQHTTGRDRNAKVTLPQDNTNLDLENNLVDYADETNFDNSKQDVNTVSHGTSETNAQAHQNQKSNSAKIDVLQALNNLYEEKLKEFDKALFLQIW